MTLKFEVNINGCIYRTDYNSYTYYFDVMDHGSSGIRLESYDEEQFIMCSIRRIRKDYYRDFHRRDFNIVNKALYCNYCDSLLKQIDKLKDKLNN